MTRPRLFVIDGANYFFRAYHAIRQLSNSQGLPTNATYGFTSMLLKLLDEQKPEYIAVAWDAHGPTFRDAISPIYKANRTEMPPDLVQQLPYIRKATEVLRVAGVELEGYEADDLIGTLARRAEQAGMDVVIVSGDKDMLQLVTEHTTLLDTNKDQISGIAEVKARYGTTPDRVVDVMGLCGDKVDNVLSIPGVGEKTAVKLIGEFGSFENVLASAHKVKGAALRENLVKYADQARLARRLVTIAVDAPIAVDLAALARREPDVEEAVRLFHELEFRTLHARFAAMRKPPPVGPARYETVSDLAALESAVAECRRAGRFSFDTETDSLDALRASLVGLSLSVRPGTAWYVPIAHGYPGAPAQISAESARRVLAPLFAEPGIAKVAFHAKFDLHVLSGWGVPVRGLASDPMIAVHLLEPEGKMHGLKNLAAEKLGVRMETFAEVMRKAVAESELTLFADLAPRSNQADATFARVPLADATAYAAADADMTLRLHEWMVPQLDPLGLRKLYEEVELPLVEVLAEMERTGVRVDRRRLEGLSDEMEKELDRLTGTIHALAGREFNIDSPKQLAALLFEEMKLPHGRRTKTGWSTDMEVLDELASQGHELARRLLEYRSLSKLKSGYVDALPGLVDPRSGRIHTTYSQTAASTGRLASSEPNLQNIPIRTEEGRKIRAAFVAPEGSVLVSADYSQIELRILAHLAQDPVLLDAFRARRDIHAETAARVFEVAPEQVTQEMRRQAKAINFGIIYGMGAFGLAAQLEIKTRDAEAIIAGYYDRYPSIKAFLDGLVEEARKTGQVTTMLGRIRPIPDIHSRNPNLRGFAERTAKNTPIQGSAADMMKVAMIRVRGALAAAGLAARMILTVHDELVLEVPEAEVERAAAAAKEGMEGALPCTVPIEVDLKYGRNWAEMAPLAGRG